MLDKVNSIKLGNATTHIVSGMAGSSITGAINALVPPNYKKHIRLGWVVSSLAVLAATQPVKGKFKPSSTALASIAVRNGLESLQDLVKDKLVITDSSPIQDKLAAGALGLACPGGCQGSWNGNLPALNMQVYDTEYVELQPKMSGNSFA